MQTTVYPNDDYSDDYFAFSSPQLFMMEDHWDFEMLPSSDDSLNGGSDMFEEKQSDFSTDTFTSVSDEEAISTTPTPSSPVPFPVEQMKVETTSYVLVRSEPLGGYALVKRETPVPVVSYAHQALTPETLAAHQQYQYQLFLQQQQQQQRMLMSMQQSSMPVPVPSAPVASVQWSHPVLSRSPIEGYSYEMNTQSYNEPLGNMFSYIPNHGSDSHVKLTNLDTSYFGGAPSSMPKLTTIPMDISVNLTDAQYNKIFKKYHTQLLLASHPTMSEKDLEDVKVHGKMYFLKNVKTIVPKVGPWKFNAHISHRRTDERQYNIPGLAVTCKVKEWLTDEGLWRLYHFKKGKNVKPKKMYE